MKNLCKEYANDDPDVKAPPGFEPKVNDLIAIKSLEDNRWYRAMNFRDERIGRYVHRFRS